MSQKLGVLGCVLMLFGCHLAPRGAWVERGDFTQTAAQLRSSESILVPHELPQDFVSIDEFEQRESCVKSANYGVQEALQGRVSVAASLGTTVLTIRVAEVRCEEVVTAMQENQRTYASQARAREVRGEVVLQVLGADGAVLLELLGRGTALTRELAAQDAGRRAAEYLWGKRP